ncbi:GapS4b family protein [Mucilaginibacter aquatilis]|uniref:GAPS4b N-terminal domain-containing protein n=1 Tax=Mucilaginibacter aquatilis TaxID=1517760 RepID=A0A6I4IQN9_9SPHI|nr:hypothetical protein [Mucilaginibacter aquatilis]MVN92023.1 hypothetical protein [Mucilaginibacter aquatilis]
MANTKVNPHSFIPSGEMIRDLANQSYISEADVKAILRQRGIFTPGTQKEKTVSILSCLLLSPPEFDVLVERQTIKEDNLKSAGSGKINLNSDFKNLTEFVHKEFLPNLVQQITPKNALLRDNYKIVGRPQAKIVVKDKEIEVEITIERSNYNKSWVNHKSQFKAIVSLMHVDNQINFQRFFTSNETKAVVNKSVSFFEKRCKELKLINEQEQEHRIRFDDFDNTGRIVFFLKLFNSTEAKTLKFEGENVVSFEFRPETSMPLPEELKWMDNKEELIFRGNRVETTFFLDEEKYYPNLIVWRMQATFKFRLVEKNVSGKVKMDFNFHEYQKDRSHKAPLEINFASAIELTDGYLTLTQRDEIKKLLLGQFEQLKSMVYQNHFNSL